VVQTEETDDEKKKIDIRRRLKCRDEREEKRKMREGRVVGRKCRSGSAVERGKGKKKKKKKRKIR
jgi:hypothetical protein